MSEFCTDWPYAFGGPSGIGRIKACPDDFIVEEILSFEPEGSGEHVFLHIEKCGENTEYIARQLARHAGVRQRDVSFAGLKDRHGRTRQWFSVWLPGKAEPDWEALQSEQLQILTRIRHARKLKRGVLAGNQFSLYIRDWQGDRLETERQLKRIKTEGFPNYFGEQRFGHHNQNLLKAEAMFQGQKVKRELRSIYLSAARAYLFNLILAERVKAQTWNQLLAGEVCRLANSNSQFQMQSLDESLSARLAGGDIHPTGVLWGKADSRSAEQLSALEHALTAAHPLLADGLLQEGVELDRRCLRVIPTDLSWEFIEPTSLQLTFRLPSGSYATALLREIIQADF